MIRQTISRMLPNGFKLITLVGAIFAAIVAPLEATNIPPESALTIDGGHVVVNDDDTNKNEIWDKSEELEIENKGLEGPKTKPAKPEPVLKMFSFKPTWANSPGKLVITLPNSSNPLLPPANIKLWKDPEKKEQFTLAASYDVTADSREPVTFWVEGIEPTESFDSIKFTAVYTVTKQPSGLSATATGTIAFGVTQADLDIDSDNKNGTEATGYDDAEDKIEFSFKEEHPGKIILETRNDVDSDGVIDNVDGIEGLTGTGGTPMVAGLKLIPMRLTLKKPFTTANAKVKFSYRASVPRIEKGITADEDAEGKPIYRITTPGIRLWTKDGDARTSGKDVGGTDSGDFIPADTEINWEDLFELDSEVSTEKIIYVEYVDVAGSDKQFSKEDIVVEISDDTSATKGYIQYNEGEKKPLLGTKSPDGVNVALLPVDLDIIKPGTETETEPEEIAEDKEDWDDKKKEGGWAASLNWDDDDNDGGVGGHGKVTFKNDFDDDDGTLNEDDLIQLKVHRIGIDNVKGKLKFDPEYFRVWKKNDRTEEVKSEETEFDIKKDEDLICYVEGIKITEAETAKQIELQIKLANQKDYNNIDDISMHVATPIILCAGWGPEYPGEETSDIIRVCTSDDEGLGTRRIDKRKNTIIIRGEDNSAKILFYQIDLFDVTPDPDSIENEVQVRIMHLDKEMKMALSLEGSHVIFSGHSNYGIGPNFNQEGTKSVDDYMNISNFSVAGIDISEFNIMEHGGTDFQVKDGDIAGTVNNQLVTIPVGYQTKRFPSVADSFTKHDAANGNPAYHFIQDDDYITIVNSMGDTPPLKYASCFMNSCNSGRHFGLSLNKKVFFYTTNDVYPTLYDPDTNVNEAAVFFASVFVSYQYIQGIVDGKTWGQNADLLTDRQKYRGVKHPDLYRYSQ